MRILIIISLIFFSSCAVTGQTQTTAQKIAALKKIVDIHTTDITTLKSDNNGTKGQIQTLQNQMKVVQDQLADIFKQLNTQQKQIDSILSYRVIFSKDFRVDSIDVLTTEIYLNTQK